MLSFISTQLENPTSANSLTDNDEEIKSSEAMQGDSALITAVNELNELREFSDKHIS